MNRQTFRVISALGLLLTTFTASAKLQAPDHVIYGNATVFGTPAATGSVIEARRPDGELLARYTLGQQSRYGDQFALHIPMDAVEPRQDGFARQGDDLQIFIGEQLAARTDVGEEGVAVRLDIDPQNLGTGPAIRFSGALPLLINEGNAGTSTAQFTLHANTTDAQNIIINWQTAAGSGASPATGGAACSAGVDYITAIGASVIPAGQQDAVISVSICGDGVIEPNESFEVQLTGTQNDHGVLQDSAASASIVDDDDLPEVQIADVRVSEPANGSIAASFQVSLSRNSSVAVSFDYATANGSASAGSDYTANSGTLTIPAGDTSASIVVNVLADAPIETEETFTLQFSNPQSVGLYNAFATARIVDPKYDPALLEHDEIDSSDANGELLQPSALVISPDGLFAYATSQPDKLLLFARNANSGDLSFIRSYDAADIGQPISSPQDLLLSADGAHLYVAALGSDAVLAFSRNAGSGELTFVNRVSDSDVGVDGLDDVVALAISPDGSNVYAVGRADSAVAVLARDSGSGALGFVETHKNGATIGVSNLSIPVALAVSPDGAQVYVAVNGSSAVTVFSRNSGDGKLSYATAYRDGIDGIDGISGASDIEMTPDGSQLYVTGAAGNENAVTLFDRAGDGSLTLNAAWRHGEGQIDGMQGPQAMALSPDGKELYVTGLTDNSVTAFTRSPSGATLGQLTVRQTMFDGENGLDLLAGPTEIVASADGRHVYVLATQDSAIVVLTRTEFATIFGDGDGGFEDP